MPRFIAFLRAINVGGHTVKMDVLRTSFGKLGFEDVETFIASGNVIFTADTTNAVSLERRIEKHLAAVLGYEVATFIRTDREVATIAACKPFSAESLEQAVAMNVGFLAEPLGSDGMRTLMTFRTESDDFHVDGRELYWLCRVRQSESRFSNVRLERALGVRATFRGLNTIARLSEKYRLIR